MKYSDSLTNIAAALSKVQAEIKNPIKNKVNGGVQGSPKYANLEDTLAEYVRPILTKHGMSVFQSLKTDENGKVGVATTLFHESGEYIESDYVFCDVIIPISNNGKKILTEGQATGVCITYLRRYSLNAALGINGDKDTDGSYSDDNEGNSDQPTYNNSTPAAAPDNLDAALAYKLSFGKYNGKTLSEIWNTDLSYIKWLANNEKTDAQIKAAINIINEAAKGAAQ